MSPQPIHPDREHYKEIRALARKLHCHLYLNVEKFHGRSPKPGRRYGLVIKGQNAHNLQLVTMCIQYFALRYHQYDDIWGEPAIWINLTNTQAVKPQPEAQSL